ncbi:50S ribosomal protein L6 [Patescibacteria group bacterium]|nr:50S ribosomal protein L6 [Patescibacteria group bacterium]
MSRIGKKPITIPQSVEINIDGNKISVRGPKGELRKEVPLEIKIEIKDDKIFVSPGKETKRTKAFWGLFRTLIFNMVKGVTDGYEKKLEIHGVGYKANLEGEDLVLLVGFSHPVKIDRIEGIEFSVEKSIITVSGIDKELVGQIAAKIRKVRKPEPYKGKGIRYLGEEIRRKAGKKVATTESAGA